MIYYIIVHAFQSIQTTEITRGGEEDGYSQRDPEHMSLG